jgi:endonuclease/exonuclease/phosphatase family metal-dependent hydrolase
MRLKKTRNVSFNSPRRRITKPWVLVFGFLIAASTLFLWWAVGTELPREAELEVARHAEFSEAQPKERLKIVSYNIAFGQGIKDSPLDWRDEAHTREKLAEVGAVIRRLDPDILFLQEVDLDSNRSHRINEADYLVTQGSFPFSACAVVWDKNYVPFPFWPPQFHIGEIKTANCILSKYPMSNHQRIIFDKPESNPFWYNWGYLDRGAQKAEIRIGTKTLHVVNLHLEAYEEEAREKQARLLLKWVDGVKGPLVLGGDFNAIPTGAKKIDGFHDEPEISYKTDTTLEIIKKGLGDFTEALPSSHCEIHERSCLTFRSDMPMRQLDHLFATRGAQFVTGNTDLDAGEASDHLPVVGMLEFSEQ